MRQRSTCFAVDDANGDRLAMQDWKCLPRTVKYKCQNEYAPAYLTCRRVNIVSRHPLFIGASGEIQNKSDHERRFELLGKPGRRQATEIGPTIRTLAPGPYSLERIYRQPH